MAIPRKRLNARLTLCFLGFLCATVLGFIFLGSRLFAFDMVRRMRNEHPELAAVPQPLPDSTVNPAEGMSLARFGYAFEVPWKDLDGIRDFDSGSAMSFKSGRRVMFMGPKAHVDRIKTIFESSAGSGKDPRSVLGARTLSSNYEFVRASLETDPTRASLLTPTNEIIRASILLLIKYSESTGFKSGLYGLESAGFRGFQKGSPATGENGATLQLFDADDHEIEIHVATANPTLAPVTQADLNRILQTLRRIDAAPDQGAQSPQHAASPPPSTRRS